MEYLIQVHGGAASAAQVGALSKEFQGLAASQEKAGAAGLTAGAKMRRGFGAANALAGKGLLALGAGAIAVGVHSVKMANTFNTEMLKIRTEGGATTKEFNHMKSALLDMASSGTSMGQGPEALAKGLYHVESMGLRGRRALLALKLAAQESAISGADLEQTTTSLGGALFIAAKGTGTLQQTMGALNAIAGAGNMRFQDLNEALGTGLLGAAKIAGISLQETGAALAVLTDSGYKASSAGAQLATSLHFLYAPTAKAQTALKTIGLSGNTLAADLRKPQGILAAMQDLRKHMSDLSKPQQANVLAAILPGGRGRVLANLYQLQGRLGPKYGQITGTSGDFGKHVMEQARNQATRLAQAHARLQAGMVRLGNVLSKYLTPALIGLEHAGAAVLNWAVQNLPVMVKLTRQGFGQLAAVGRDAWHVLVQIGNACTAFGQVLINIGKVIVGFISGGLKMFVQGWHDLMGVLSPVISALNTVASAATTAGNAVGSVVSSSSGPTTAATPRSATPRAFGPASPPATPRAPASPSVGPPILAPHAAYNGGDIHVHIAGHHFAKVTKREIQKAMMAGG